MTRDGAMLPAAAALPLSLPAEGALMLHTAASAMGIAPADLGALAPALGLCSRADGHWASTDSLLTPGGCPFELAVGPEPDKLRITVEPCAAPATPPLKWARIAAATGIEPSIRPLIQALARCPGQRFGCWLGARLPAGRDVEWKVYQEVPAGAVEAARRFLSEGLGSGIIADRFVPRLVGALPGGDATEIYGRLIRPDPGLLHGLLSAAGEGALFPAAATALAEACGTAQAEVYRCARLYASLRLSPGRAPLVTLFVLAPEVAPANREVRRRVEALAGQLSCPLPAYGAVAGALDLDGEPFNVHGMLAMHVGPGGRLGCSIGLGPRRIARRHVVTCRPP